MYKISLTISAIERILFELFEILARNVDDNIKFINFFSILNRCNKMFSSIKKYFIIIKVFQLNKSHSKFVRYNNSFLLLFKY